MTIPYSYRGWVGRREQAYVGTTLPPLRTAEDLVLEEVPVPDPGPGEVRIRVAAAGLNFPDVRIVQGLYQLKPPSPSRPAVRRPARSMPLAKA